MPRIPKPWFRKGRGWFVQLDRKQVPLGPDRDAAFAEYHRLMLQPREHRQVSGQALVAVIDKFPCWVEAKRAPQTFAWYRDLLQKFATAHPTLRVTELKPFHVSEWVDGLVGLSTTSQRNHMRAVKRCLRWAKKQGYIDANLIEDLEVPAGKSREVCLSLSQYESLLAHASPDSLRDLITVTWETGCRPQESLRVEARHVDLENQRWVVPKSEAKGEKLVRVVYLTDEALRITERLMLKHPNGKLFRTSTGKPWTADSVNSAFDRIRIRMGKKLIENNDQLPTEEEVSAKMLLLSPTKKVGGVAQPKTSAELRCEARRKLTNQLAATLAPRYSLYALRHSWATHALEKGVDPITVGVLMGHPDPSMLAKTYQHVSKNPAFMLSQARKASARA
ncbi:MAG: tyrosine-type recombinase/integrase [Planctomycetota bacterium]